MNPTSFDASLGAVQLQIVGTSEVVPTTFAITVNGTTVTLTPTTALTSGVQYQLTISYFSDVAGVSGTGGTYASSMFTAQ